MRRSSSYARFPGRPAVLKALRAAGTWTPHDVFAWSAGNGGSKHAYAALRHYVKLGKVKHHAKSDDSSEHWSFVARYTPEETQIR